MTTSTTENKQQATQSNESAFDQEGPGTTMAPPKFGLMASPAESGMAGKEGGEATAKTNGYDIEGFYNERIAAFKESKKKIELENATRQIMRHYGMYDEELIKIVIVDKIKPAAYATTESAYGLGKLETLTVSVDTFKKGFSFVSRTLLHEYQHMVYRWKNENGSKAENEFLAYYAELFNDHAEENPNGSNPIFEVDPQKNSIPFHESNKDIKLALYNGMSYFEDMTMEQQDLHQKKYDKMLQMKSKLKNQKK